MSSSRPSWTFFVDKDDVIRYFGGSCGFYPHSKNDLGMNMFSIHMPKSVSKVKAIVDDLRSGRKDKHAFWFEVRGRFVYIQYLAVRNKAGEYLGVLEVLQDITDLRALQGKKKEL
ncbi:PAS domain-containing protein [Lactobacillus delbrueckii subsp. bulgaricus]